MFSQFQQLLKIQYRHCALMAKNFAVRMPNHPVARALIALSDTPLAAPSANLSTRPSPTSASHVYADLHDRIPLILMEAPVMLVSKVLLLTVLFLRQNFFVLEAFPSNKSVNKVVLFGSPLLLIPRYKPRTSPTHSWNEVQALFSIVSRIPFH